MIMDLFRRAGSVPAPALRCAARLMSLAIVASALPAMAAAPPGAQIFKCTDASGNVTYQNEPCPKNVKAGRVDIFDNSWTTDRVEKEAEWRRNAAEHRVVAGMPVHWVREALGEPAEVRDTATAGAAEVWVYNLPDRNVQVGVLNSQVLWFREAPVVAPAARVTPPPDRPEPERAQLEPQVTRAAPAPDRSAPELPVTRMAPPGPEHASRDVSSAPSDASHATADAAATAAASAKRPSPAGTVARGQDCKQAIASLGPPDRQRDVPALDAGSDPATEYFYEPAGGAGATRTRIVCANGKIEGVDRTVIR
jgi:uncharacterized protein DUF4124